MAKKKTHDEELQRGLEKFREYGIPIDEPSAGLIESIKSNLGRGRDTDIAAAFLLGRIAEPAAVESLTDLENTASDKEVHREIRRSLYKLSQKGLTAGRPESGKPELQKRILSLSPEIEAYTSSVDSIGGRLIWLAKPQAGSGLQLLQGMVNDREGLVQAGGAVMRRKELRRMAEDIRERHGVMMISIPWEYADRVLYEGFEKATAAGRSGLHNFSSLRSVFNLNKPKMVTHPVYGRLKSDEVRAGVWRELSRRLLDEPEICPWILDEDWMKPYREQAEEAQESRLVLNQAQKEERLAGIVRDASREIFSGERGRIFQRRMEDMAVYFLETQREESAKLAFAVAVAIHEGDLGGLGALDIAFLTGLVQKSLVFYLQQAKQKNTEESSLIVKP